MTVPWLLGGMTASIHRSPENGPFAAISDPADDPVVRLQFGQQPRVVLADEPFLAAMRAVFGQVEQPERTGQPAVQYLRLDRLPAGMQALGSGFCGQTDLLVVAEVEVLSPLADNFG